MAKILQNKEIAPQIFEMILEDKQVVAKARPGQFCIVMADEQGERIPLTLADWNIQEGTIYLIYMKIGKSTIKLSKLQEGTDIYAFVAPLGKASEVIDYKGHIILVAGGIGAAPVYPIAKWFYQNNRTVSIIHGARTANLLFWQEKLQKVSTNYIITTDDGSYGEKNLVTTPLKQLLNNKENDISCVYAIGPAIMMKFCSETTKEFGTKTITSLNSVMIDGTGMCGGCRVNVGNKQLFACVDGPEFDGHLVDWETLLKRQKTYHHEEKCALQTLENNYIK